MSDLIGKDKVKAQYINPADDIHIGQWYLVDGNLYCITSIGTNYAGFCGPNLNSIRVHFNEFWDRCIIEPNAKEIIRGRIQEIQQHVFTLLNEARAITASVSVNETSKAEPETQALARLDTPPEDYKAALMEAKDKTLPDIFKKIKDKHKLLAIYMESDLLPMEAELFLMQGAIQKIQDRIFSIDLYAGLSEVVTCIREGAAAAYEEKVHIMQRRLYMDEECLLEYEAGGMEFKNIEAFDEWLSRESNMKRILPFERCLVVMKVRRIRKDRNGEEFEGVGGSFIRIRLEQADKHTFMYFRNGEKLFRMSTKMDFPEKMFGDADFNLSGKLWYHCYNDSLRGNKPITDALYQQMCEENAAATKRVEEFMERNPGFDSWKSPGTHDSEERKTHHTLCRELRECQRGLNDMSGYVEFSPETVLFDDMKKLIEETIVERNRIAVIMQGLFDRSPVFHPHAPAELWTFEGFNKSIELVHDADKALYEYEVAPDFEAYRKKGLDKLKVGDVTIGQYDLWRNHMIMKYNKDSRRNYGYSARDSEKIPYGNPGPGTLHRVLKIQKNTKKCTFQWNRLRAGGSKWDDYGRKKSRTIPTSFTCDSSTLFNVSAYKKGDFKQFFQDPRTRIEYLKWAPLMLHAEDFLAGKVEVDEDRYEEY